MSGPRSTRRCESQRWAALLGFAVLLAGCGEEDEGCPAIQRIIAIEVRGVPGDEVTALTLTQADRVSDITEHCDSRTDGVFCGSHEVSLTHHVPVEIEIETSTATHTRSVMLREEGCELEPNPIVVELP